ncbi:MAG TPA: signal recognition particle protein [Candidatus Hydrogenedentes bacterium]|nr:signal recognition particle protein [Candidatus Hydrogenedentota bacterium]HOC73705.1 signal recognition particle protein [Candidatus Hydrogenedentota bacterium]HOH50962.1 signal recognition particle protein [Candidatus Hydrogenedentota bacterium]HPA41345.1 signal recognition particle protein [Candidatus Hydrogenedentota bacterium]HQL95293.1 signal recognition particle protein [Candidatus Hydrogenedentota bacterium]
MFESLTKRLESAFKSIRGQGRLTEANMKDALQQIRQALLEADVHYKVVQKFITDVQAAAVGQKVLESIHPGQMIVKIVHDELVRLMGAQNEPLTFAAKPPTVIMMVGLQGQGKTTTAGKLAVMLKRQGRKPLLVGADVYRPAAIEQLEIVAGQAGVESFSLGVKANPVDICLMARGEASLRGCDVLILDTAGRLHVDEEMMGEVRRIAAQMAPQEILFVASAMTGQDAVRSAKQFNDAVPLTGVVLTQMDGDARGGAAISIIEVTGRPVKFVGTGEKLDALEPFHPGRMADQILGMGDVVSLVEKAQQVVDQKQALDFQKKARKGDWNLEDFLAQMQQVKKLGAFGDIIKKIPGLGKMMPDDLDGAEDELKYTEAIILSMTRKERRNPVIINGSRRRRIAEGSGTTVQEVNALLKDFQKMRDMMKQMMRGPKGGGKGRGLRGPLPPMPGR